MALFSDRVLVTVGLRDQTIDQKNASGTTLYKASAVTPLAGVVFKPQNNVSVYANYTAGLSAGGTAGPTRPMPARCSRRRSPSSTKWA